MNCGSCGHSNREGAKFCEQCGTALALHCAKCATALREGARFCDSCGLAVGEASPPDARLQELRSSTPENIVRAIKRDHAEMEGERRVVTVLFADAVGHTSIAETLDPEELYGLMQGCFERMQGAVHLYEGTVNQFTGDGILALFGAPIAHEDSARRAVSAALEMQRQLGCYATEVKKKYPVDCSYRVGLNTGPVVVGRISEGLDLEFAAIGDTVNLAARMESMAESGSVYISENTYRAVEDYFEFETVGPLDVKGKSKPVIVYKPTGEKAVRRRFEAVSQRGLTRYVGRDEELSLLTSYLRRTHAQQGQVVLVTGDAGMGKSRLLLEFKNSESEGSLHWLEGQCASFGRTTAYLPFLDIVKQAAGIVDGDDEAAMQSKIDAATADWPTEQQASRPYLKYLLQIEPDDNEVRDMDPIQRKVGTLEALRTFVRQFSARGRLVLVVEDLHWCDEQSMEVLSSLIEVAAHSQVLLVLTSRPGHSLPSIERSYFSRLALTSLPKDQSTAMIEGVLEASGLPPKLIDIIASKAEGNPFYIEEVTKSLVESGALERRNGGYVLKRPAESIHVPNTIQEVILARMDRLDRDARGAMQVASVIGREFAVRLLSRISDVELRLDGLLGDLKTLELIYESGYAPELSYMFKHALTHDVAYATLLKERRRALHLMVAQAIEDIYGERLREHYEALAHHYEEAEEWKKALDYLELAGDKARSAYANQAALGYYARALDVCGRLGRGAAERAMRIAEKRVWICFVTSEFDAGVQQIAWMLAMARRRRDVELETSTLALKGFFETYAHDFDSCEISIDASIALANEHKLEELRIVGEMTRFGFLKITNRHQEAQESRALIESASVPVSNPNAVGYYYYISALDTAWKGQYVDGLRQARRWRDNPVKPPHIMTYHLRWCEALLAAGAGDYNDSLATLTEIELQCQRMGEVSLRARCLNTLGWIHGMLQDHERAIDLNLQGIEVALLEGDEPEKLCNARLNCVDTLLTLGRLDDAATHLVEVERTVRNPRPEDRWMLWRFSQHYLAAAAAHGMAEEKYDLGLSLATECLELAESSGSAKYIVRAQRLCGEAMIGLGDPAAAVLAFESATRTAEAIQNPSESWAMHAAVGNVFQRHGDTARATQSFGAARGIIEGVAANLRDESMVETLRKSEAFRSLVGA